MKSKEYGEPVMNSKHGILAFVNLLLVGALGYGLFSINSTLEDRIAKVESASQDTQTASEQDKQARAEREKKLIDALADLELIKERVGVTSTEMTRARQMAQSLKQQQERAAKELASQLAGKANSTEVDSLRQEATAKIAAVQEDSNAKIGNVSGELTGIKRDLLATSEDWSRQLVDVKNGLSERIATNSAELADLRKKGDRDYFEFDIRKNSKQPLHKVADLQLALLKTDPKKHMYNVAIQVDDNRLEKKDRTTNEPIQFLVGRDHLRYEVVVNSVDKDRIRGYVSAPKDIVPSAETPRFRLQ
jgi:hypothetical protein